jgi:hypothetical protein
MSLINYLWIFEENRFKKYIYEIEVGILMLLIKRKWNEYDLKYK